MDFIEDDETTQLAQPQQRFARVYLASPMVEFTRSGRNELKICVLGRRDLDIDAHGVDEVNPCTPLSATPPE
ncbi:MAG: hypothetical protein GEU99_14185 [Luteitalea sp.]|nr:hypothetical protein [Luteitalea sp.]